MLKYRMSFCRIICIVICSAIVLGFSGCNEARVNILFAANADTEKVAVEQDAIKSLVVSVTGVNLIRSDGESGEVPLTITPVDVDLVQLDGVAALLNSATIPTGVYNQIRLDIENPRLVLVADPETVITDVHFGANSRFMVAERFAAYAGTTNNIVLDVEGIHLVSEGNGGYTLTPMLRARFRDDTLPMLAQGVVVSVDAANDSIILGLPDTDVAVRIENAAIYLPGEVEIGSGTTDDLVEGVAVLVEGTVNAGGIIRAAKITILPPEEG